MSRTPLRVSHALWLSVSKSPEVRGVARALGGLGNALGDFRQTNRPPPPVTLQLASGREMGKVLCLALSEFDKPDCIDWGAIAAEGWIWTSKNS